MARLLFASILLIGCVSSVYMQNGYGQSIIPSMQGNMPQTPGFLSNILGGGNNGGGLGATISQLPARGMQMLNNVFSGVRNLLPGLGRNGKSLLL